jgi:hypothetical protein|tara:strand:+ start:19297 stop:19680 length:384 start_codon:yes stop_codon:yes gene_type:complete
MTFQIKTLRGELKTLGIQSILKLLGDSINDEIVLEGTAFRISSANWISSANASVDWVMTPLPITVSSQEVFALPKVIEDPESAFLTINNVDYLFGVHYHFDGLNLIWHGAFSLEPTDELYIKYPLTA